MAKPATDSEFDIDALSEDVKLRFDDVPWKLYDSKDLASSGETRFMISRIQADLMKVANVDQARAAHIWQEHVPDYVPRPEGLQTLDPEPDPVNGMEPQKRRRNLQAEPYLDAVPEEQSMQDKDHENASPKVGPQLKIAKKGESKDAEDAKWPDPARKHFLVEGLNKQYLKADDKYHFRDRCGQVAFEAQDKKLVTQHDTPAVVSSMIDLAETRGWSSLKLTGTQEFRREAWLKANLREFEVSGYKPSKLDKARLEELRVTRTPRDPANAIEPQSGPTPNGRGVRFGTLPEQSVSEPKLALSPTQDQFLRVMEATMRHRGDSDAAITKARELAHERLTSDRVHVGTLVEIGSAPYQDKPGETLSHYLALQNEQGVTSKVWGVDLPRAVGASEAEVGQRVAVVFRGREPVSAKEPERAGSPLEVQQQRNRWEVVQFDRLRDEAKASVLKALQEQGKPIEVKVFDRSARSAATRTNSQQRLIRSHER